MVRLDNAFALIIGIAHYWNIRPLPEIVLKDAKDIYALLTEPQSCAYQIDNVQLLLDEQATRTNIIEALIKLSERCNAESTVCIYISGHGGYIADGRWADAYILPIDVNIRDEKELAETAISGQTFNALLHTIAARKIFIMFDCCHAGGIGETKATTTPALKSGLPERYYDQLQSGQGRVIIASSLSTELSWIMPDAENSLFTSCVLDGLRGGVPTSDGLIRVFDLFEYIQPRVTQAQPRQHPLFKAQIQENFPIALYLGGQKSANAHVQTDDGFLYDAYISFADQGSERTWVRKVLLPHLREARLQVAISRDVEEPGVSRVVSRERGMVQARRTVLILSKASLSDNWASIEGIMMQDRGVQRGEWIVLPLKIEPLDDVTLPLRLSMLSMIDLTDPDEEVYEFERLVKALQRPLPRM